VTVKTLRIILNADGSPGMVIACTSLPALATAKG